jgi:hypothetical protein
MNSIEIFNLCYISLSLIVKFFICLTVWIFFHAISSVINLWSNKRITQWFEVKNNSVYEQFRQIKSLIIFLRLFCLRELSLCWRIHSNYQTIFNYMKAYDSYELTFWKLLFILETPNDKKYWDSTQARLLESGSNPESES